ncbi:hypothetical protein [Actinomadura rubrisoli]|uniref:Uncharacterized protein n=1 Tax=Actinomadura rubrisoli TaxID=2530368 RepID=A0A4R5CHB3_9ACTN|nr:hypothetical protein [Actinomadura rubrisoli]TDD97693.1 hypothetical protein E1298_01260 [Actinomadura rubrisoli]
MISMILLGATGFIQDSKLLLGTGFVLAVYVLVVGQVTEVFDPECSDVSHQHDDCPACGDLPPLVPVQVFLQRLRRRTPR